VTAKFATTLNFATAELLVNLLMLILKPQNNGPLYCNTVIGTLAVDGWAVTFGTARPRPVPSSLYQM